MKRLAALFIVLLLPFQVVALELSIPVKCSVGADCFVQNYPDMQPGSEAKDYRCGVMSFDNNRATEFRLKNYLQMELGVGALAAADGKVIGVRDGMEDINVRDINPESVSGQECGNGVVIDHGDGWETQYCHLHKGMIYVKKGQEVKAGDLLGRIGMSGETYYPHLALLVRKDGFYIDPFTGRKVSTACMTEPPTESLWNADAQKTLQPVETALLGMGFTDAKPDGEMARWGKYSEKTLSIDTPVLTLWTDIMGIKTGDILMLEIFDPGQHRILQHQKNFTENKAQQFYFAGQRVQDESSWEPGIYQGRVTLMRNISGTPQAIIKKTIEVYLR